MGQKCEKGAYVYETRMGKKNEKGGQKQIGPKTLVIKKMGKLC